MPAPVAPITLTAAGLSPDRADRATFVARSIARDDFIKNTQIPQLQTAITNVYNNSLEAYNSGVSATADAASSAINASQAASAATAIQWVSGTTYAIGDARWSPITKISYRRIVAGAGTTDPSLDVTNWANIGAAPSVLSSDIINGNFRIAQAGTSFAAPANGAYDLDGWLNNNGSAAVFTVAQAAGSAAGRLARQVTITTVDAAVAAADHVVDTTFIEGFNIEKYVGKTFTVAFRAKVPVAGIHCIALRNTSADRSYVKEINFPTANTWQDCSFTVVGGLPTAGVWDYTNGIGLRVSFAHMCGTTFQTTPDTWNTGNFLGTTNQVNDCATVSNVWALEKFTLNLGSFAAVSEISHEQELIRCQRYYETVGILFVTTVVGVFPRAGWAVAKRAAPTLTILVTGGTGATVANTVNDPTGGFYQNANNTLDTNARVSGAARL